MATTDLLLEEPGLLTKPVVTQEQVCPVGPLGPIDRWEMGRPWMSQG